MTVLGDQLGKRFLRKNKKSKSVGFLHPKQHAQAFSVSAEMGSTYTEICFICSLCFRCQRNGGLSWEIQFWHLFSSAPLFIERIKGRECQQAQVPSQQPVQDRLGQVLPAEAVQQSRAADAAGHMLGCGCSLVHQGESCSCFLSVGCCSYVSLSVEKLPLASKVPVCWPDTCFCKHSCLLPVLAVFLLQSQNSIVLTEWTAKSKLL